MSITSIPFKKLDPEAKLPARAHASDAGLDLYSLQDVILNPSEPVRIQTGIAMAVPHAHVGLICDRSSMGAKGIRVLGGVVDSGYRGEVQVLLINLRREPQQIKKGDKIAQILILPVNLAMPHETQDLDETTRGSSGFGSSGR